MEALLSGLMAEILSRAFRQRDFRHLAARFAHKVLGFLIVVARFRTHLVALLAGNVMNESDFLENRQGSIDAYDIHFEPALTHLFLQAVRPNGSIARFKSVENLDSGLGKPESVLFESGFEQRAIHTKLSGSIGQSLIILTPDGGFSPIFWKKTLAH